jgi:hypothetical protein
MLVRRPNPGEIQMRIHPSRLLHACVLVLAVALSPEGVRAETGADLPDWAEVSEVQTVEVVTLDEDGDQRETTVWLAVVDGQGYIRTGGTRWGANLERDPQLTLRIEEREWALRIAVVDDEALHERITAAFREKYGFSDSMIGLVRGSNPTIMHLVPR